MQGRNGTVLAYGQTGTGKTYTMGILKTTDERRASGIIPLSLRRLFKKINADTTAKHTVHMSFLQVVGRVLCSAWTGFGNAYMCLYPVFVPDAITYPCAPLHESEIWK